MVVPRWGSKTFALAPKTMEFDNGLQCCRDCSVGIEGRQESQRERKP